MKNRFTAMAWSSRLAMISAALLGGVLSAQAQVNGKAPGVAPVADTHVAAPALMAVVTRAANNAQQRCNELGHDNLDEYASCTDALFKAVKGSTAKASGERLGILYFGWVGAEHWLRVGLPGAQEAAKRYFNQFRPLQQELALSDQSLCAALAGDCTVRLAQVAAAVREYGVPERKSAGAKAINKAAATTAAGQTRPTD